MSDVWDRSHRPSRVWRSGPWSLELRDDELADLAHSGRPVLRSIRAVVRDGDWNTAGWIVEDVSESADGLRLGLRSSGRGSDIRGTLAAEVSGDAVTVRFDAVSLTAFATNRTGLVVLHPPQLAGRELVVTHSDGARETTRFPAAISPHQPALDISALTWDAGGLTVDVRFSGDVFEMEDQRNWTDASYKTYSRPLALPFPYTLQAGERIAQSVEVSARTTGSMTEGARVDRVVLERAGSFPALAVGASTAPDPAPAVVTVGSALLVELDLASPNWQAALRRAAASGLPLDVRFVLDEDDVTTVAAAVTALASHRVARVAAFRSTGSAQHVSDAAAVRLLRDALAGAGLDVPVVGGARSHFTELNRENHRVPQDLDGIVFSVTPLFHDQSTEQLVESLAMQRLVAQQAVRIAGGMAVHIGPVTLRPRFNNVATTRPPRSSRSDLAAGYGPQLADADDERQMAPELAAWTIASAAALAVPGVSTLTYFEEWGPRGIRTADGVDLPAADAVRALERLSGSTLLSGESPDGLLWAIGGETDSGATMLVASLDRRARAVTVEVAGDAYEMDLPGRAWGRLDIPAGAHCG